MISLVVIISSRITPGGAEGKGELATCRLAQTAGGKPEQKVRCHSLDRLNASMIKKKNTLQEVGSSDV